MGPPLHYGRIQRKNTSTGNNKNIQILYVYLLVDDEENSFAEMLQKKKRLCYARNFYTISKNMIYDWIHSNKKCIRHVRRAKDKTMRYNV